MLKWKANFFSRFSLWWRIWWSNEFKFVCFQIKWNRNDDLFFCFRIWTDETKRKINEIIEIKRHHLPQFESNIFCRYRFLSTVNGVHLPIGNLTDYTAESIYESCLNSSSSWFASHVIYVLIVSSTVSSLGGCLTTSFSSVVGIHSLYRHRHFNETNDESLNINPDSFFESRLIEFHHFLYQLVELIVLYVIGSSIYQFVLFDGVVKQSLILIHAWFACISIWWSSSILVIINHFWNNRVEFNSSSNCVNCSSIVMRTFIASRNSILYSFVSSNVFASLFVNLNCFLFHF